MGAPDETPAGLKFVVPSGGWAAAVWRGAGAGRGAGAWTLRGAGAGRALAVGPEGSSPVREGHRESSVNSQPASATAATTMMALEKSIPSTRLGQVHQDHGFCRDDA